MYIFINNNFGFSIFIGILMAIRYRQNRMSLYEPCYVVIVSLAKLGLIMIYFYICDRYFYKFILLLFHNNILLILTHYFLLEPIFSWKKTNITQTQVFGCLWAMYLFLVYFLLKKVGIQKFFIEIKLTNGKVLYLKCLFFNNIYLYFILTILLWILKKMFMESTKIINSFKMTYINVTIILLWFLYMR